MPLPMNRRIVLFLLLDSFILLSLAGVFAAVHRVVVPVSPVPANAKLAPTPNPSVTAWPQTAATPVAVIPNTIKIAASVPHPDAEPGQTVDLSHLRCKKIKVISHPIEMGENYCGISKDANIDVLTLIGANPGLPYKAKINQLLYLLPQRGVLHTVVKEDSAASIALAYGVNEKDLRDANDIHWWHRLHPGDVLFVPGARPILMTKEWRDYYSRRGIFGDPLGRWGKINSPFSVRTDPLTGEIRHHNGVDLKAKYGDPVYAAGSGKVVFTGISGGYGNLIQIAHGNGYLTFYGHLSKIYAKQGQHVRKGVLIGRVGATGRVTGPHLHFEIRKAGKPLDPLLYI